MERSQIVDYVYLLSSWKLYLNAISKRPVTWWDRLYAMIGKDFEENLTNKAIPMHVRASCPEELWNMLVDSYGEEEAF